MAEGLVDARWVAPYEAQLPDKTVLVPGETVVQVSGEEAKASDHWQVVGTAKPPTKAELKAQLDELGIEVPKGATKADLEQLLNQPAPDKPSTAAPSEEPSEEPTEGAEE